MTELTMTESQITQAATQYMGQPAWATVFVAIASVTVYALLFVGAAEGVVPLWLAFIFTSYLVYVIYTPLHEAVHKNICGRQKSLLRLNNAVGYLSACLLGVSFTMHRAAHMAHHRSTNVAGEDPDFVTSGSSFFDVLSCGSKMVANEYVDYFSKFFPKASSREKSTVVIEIALFLGWRVLLFANGFATEVLVLALLANVVGVSLLGYIFAWIVHTPFNKTGRFEDTATILLPELIHKPVTVLWLWQNYHSIHHLYPKVPFYRYAQLFNRIRPGMEERHAPILVLG